MHEACTHEIHPSGGHDVRSWAVDLEPNTLQQALRTARCAAVAGPVALMPDAHLGLGATVGSVIPTDGAIIPAAVGVDIGCGMIAVETDLSASVLPDDLHPVLAAFHRAVPAGRRGHDHPTRGARNWLAAHPLRADAPLTTRQRTNVADQLGSLGGGNHFVELCLDERQHVWLVLHSGSRGVGNALAQHHIGRARHLCAALERAVEDRDLAYFLDTDDAFHAYLRDMLWAQDYALANRALLMDAVVEVLRTFLGRTFTERRRINCHHNYTAREQHDGRNLWITRKGAIRARPDDWGVIPGSMGTTTFVVRGLGNDASYHSASHGAGRRHSRTEAKRRFDASDLAAAMVGRTWQHDKAGELVDEAPMAYKDVHEVMAAQRDLVEIRHRLEAIVNYKGTS
jgi:RNA-splicing ligase RtcB